MGGAFERLDETASRTVDAVNAITVVITPMRAAPNGAACSGSTPG